VVSDDEGASRRALLSGAGAALVGAGALALAGCGNSNNAGMPAVESAAAPVQRADLNILSGLLELERRTVAAYTAGLPLLNHAHARLAKQFLTEELQHTGELLSLIKAAGGSDPPRPGSYNLGRPHDDRAVLALLHRLERAQIGAYLQAIPRLKPGPVRAAAATILNSDAQHVALLRLNQGMVPAPSAFVTANE
jgi:Ferritin-like domain